MPDEADPDQAEPDEAGSNEVVPVAEEPEQVVAFPPPSQLRRYEEIHPGFTARLFSLAERKLEFDQETAKYKIQHEERTSRIAWVTRELRLGIFGVLSMTYLFVGLLVGFDQRATAVMLIVALATGLETLWSRLRRRMQAGRDDDAGDDG